MSSGIPPPPPLDLLPVRQDKHWLVSSPTEDFEDHTKNTLNQWVELENIQENSMVAMWRKTPKTIIQQGPQCGLVALSMAAESLGLSADTELLFNKAKEMGITKQGEMFCAANLCKLANCFNINSTLGEGIIHNTEIILKILSSGKILLVPYDSDSNHHPCLKNGHKAHWAVVYGFVALIDEIKDTHYDNIENLGQNCYRIRSLNCSQQSLWKQAGKENIYVMAKQGKSKQIGIWSLSKLADSNGNLSEVDPKRNSPIDYIVPLGNKLTGLCGKIIVIG